MTSQRLRFELLLAGVCIAVGALVLPSLVYGVGVLLLGKYADGGLGAFYGNLYRDLAGASVPAASLIFGPWLVITLARLPLIGRQRQRKASVATDPAPSESPPARRTRVEPRIGH
jgi:hypothetical protein